jgi:hypothetical protein
MAYRLSLFRAAAQPGDDAKITALKAQAQKAIEDGELGKAKEILAKVEKIQDEALERLALNAAQTAAQRARAAPMGHEHRQSRCCHNAARRKARRSGDRETGGSADRGGFHDIARRRRRAFRCHF